MAVIFRLSTVALFNERHKAQILYENAVCYRDETLQENLQHTATRLDFVVIPVAIFQIRLRYS